MLQMVWQGPRASQTLRLCWQHLSTRPIHCRPCVYIVHVRQLHTCMHTTAAALISVQTDVDADAMCDGVCVL